MQDERTGPNPSGLCFCGCGERTKIAERTQADRFCVKGDYKRYVAGHRHRAPQPTLQRYIEEDRGHDTPCWVWQGPKNLQGYGRSTIDGRSQSAYRAFYEHHVGPIPEGLHLDHLCCVPLCVNPAHLEPVTAQENNRRSNSPSARNARKTHCPQGHLYDEENTYVRPDGGRDCKTCGRERNRRWWATRKAAKPDARASAKPE